MSIDRRLRHDLQRDADRIVVDVERNLGAVEGRTRRPRSSGIMPALAAAVVIAIAIVLRVQGPPSVGTATPAPTATEPAGSSAPAYAAIAGMYRVALDAGVEVGDVQGTWTMELVDDGAMVLSPPPTFTGSSGAPTGVSFSITGDQLRTDLFWNDYCRSLGTYTWSRADRLLTLTPVTEDCAIRRAVLATAPWTELP